MNTAQKSYADQEEDDGGTVDRETETRTNTGRSALVPPHTEDTVDGALVRHGHFHWTRLGP